MCADVVKAIGDSLLINSKPQSVCVLTCVCSLLKGSGRVIDACLGTVNTHTHSGSGWREGWSYAANIIHLVLICESPALSILMSQPELWVILHTWLHTHELWERKIEIHMSCSCVSSDSLHLLFVWCREKGGRRRQSSARAGNEEERLFWSLWTVITTYSCFLPGVPSGHEGRKGEEDECYGAEAW